MSVTGLNFLFDCGWPLKVILQCKQGLTVWYIIVSLVEKYGPFILFFYTFNQQSNIIYLISKNLNQTKPNYIFLIFCSAKSLTITEFKYKISLRALCGNTMNILKNS